MLFDDEMDAVNAFACRKLWAHVLHAAWDLAVTPNRCEPPGEVKAARAWFGTRDFHIVCALAGVDGMAVLDRYRKRRGAAA